jgi:hypothetical protein
MIPDVRGNAYVKGGGFNDGAGEPFAPGNIALPTPDGSARQAADGAVRRPRRPETAHRRRRPLRVVDEFVSRRAGTTTLRGPALHCGGGVSYWSIASLSKSAAGISDDEPDASAKLRAASEDDAVAELLAAVLGVEGGPQPVRDRRRSRRRFRSCANPLRRCSVSAIVSPASGV